jgi:copper transport protein
LRDLDALWTTDYGLVLSGKLALVLASLALAAANRYGFTPRVAAGDATAARRLGRTIRLETVIVAAILGLVAGWRFTPPPRTLLAAAEAPVYLHVHTEKAMADIKLERTREGARRVTLTLLDGEFGPLAAKEVTVLLARPEAGIEPLRLPATHVDETIWRIEAVRLPMPGRWHVRVEILVNDFEKVAIEDDVELRR